MWSVFNWNSQQMGRECDFVLTTIIETIGYFSLQCLSLPTITTKANVYSFGKMLFEIIAGWRIADGVSQSSDLFFPTWAAMQIKNDNSMGDKEALNNKFSALKFWRVNVPGRSATHTIIDKGNLLICYRQMMKLCLFFKSIWCQISLWDTMGGSQILNRSRVCPHNNHYPSNGWD